MSFKKLFKVDKEKTSETQSQVLNEDSSKDPEKILQKNNFKIKKKFGTKFGTEFVLAKHYEQKDIKDALKGFKLIFDGNSVFVQF